MILFDNNRTYLEFANNYLNVIQLNQKEILYQQQFSLENKGDIELSSYLNQAPNSVKEVSIVVSPTKLINRTLDLPLTAKEKIEEIIRLEFLNKLPYDEDELYFSYQIIKKNERLKVLGFAVNKEFINKLYQLCSEANLTIKSIIPGSLTFYHLHNDEKRESEPTLYLDAKDGYQHFAFLGGEEVYLRSSRINSDLQGEIEKTISYLIDEYQLSNKPVLIVNGDRVSYDKLDFVSTNKNMNNNFFWSKIKKVEQDLQGHDFLSQLPQNKNQEKKESYRKLSILIVLILLINSLAFAMQWQIKQDKLKNLKARLSQVKPVVNRVNQIKRDYQVNLQKLKQLKGEVRTNYSYLPWLKELSLILSNETTINRVNFKEDKLVLLAGEANSATEVMEVLEESEYFSNLYFIGSIVSKNDREEFKIAGDLVEEVE